MFSAFGKELSLTKRKRAPLQTKVNFFFIAITFEIMSAAPSDPAPGKSFIKSQANICLLRENVMLSDTKAWKRNKISGETF